MYLRCTCDIIGRETTIRTVICRVGQNRIYTPYTWWFPCQNYHMYHVYTVHSWFWPTLVICGVRAQFWPTLHIVLYYNKRRATVLVYIHVCTYMHTTHTHAHTHTHILYCLTTKNARESFRKARLAQSRPAASHDNNRRARKLPISTSCSITPCS
jgi:hypothetical protein